MTMIAYCRSSPKASLADDFAWSLRLFEQRTGSAPVAVVGHSDDLILMDVPRRLSQATTARVGAWCLTDDLADMVAT